MPGVSLSTVFLATFYVNGASESTRSSQDYRIAQYDFLLPRLHILDYCYTHEAWNIRPNVQFDDCYLREQYPICQTHRLDSHGAAGQYFRGSVAPPDWLPTLMVFAHLCQVAPIDPCSPKLSSGLWSREHGTAFTMSQRATDGQILGMGGQIDCKNQRAFVFNDRSPDEPQPQKSYLL